MPNPTAARAKLSMSARVGSSAREVMRVVMAGGVVCGASSGLVSGGSTRRMGIGAGTSRSPAGHVVRVDRAPHRRAATAQQVKQMPSDGHTCRRAATAQQIR
jgi:hypothetical protein